MPAKEVDAPTTPGPYRRVSTCLWQDARFRALSPLAPSGQALWVYLLAGEFTTALPGVLRVGLAALAEALGWPLEDLRRCWGEIERQALAEADWERRVLWLPRAIRHNAPANPNQVKGWSAAWAGVPECPLKDRARTELEAHMRRRGPAFLAAFRVACPPAGKGRGEPSPNSSTNRSGNGSGNGMANQEQELEQEREQEREQEKGSCAEPTAGAVAAAPPPAPASPVVVSLPLVGRGAKSYPITGAQVAEWQAAFPGVDAAGEMRRAAAWLTANPSRRKTPRGVLRFCHSWLSRAQDRAGANGGLPLDQPRRRERIFRAGGPPEGVLE